MTDISIAIFSQALSPKQVKLLKKQTGSTSFVRLRKIPVHIAVIMPHILNIEIPDEGCAYELTGYRSALALEFLKELPLLMYRTNNVPTGPFIDFYNHAFAQHSIKTGIKRALDFVELYNRHLKDFGIIPNDALLKQKFEGLETSVSTDLVKVKEECERYFKLIKPT